MAGLLVSIASLIMSVIGIVVLIALYPIAIKLQQRFFVSLYLKGKKDYIPLIFLATTFIAWGLGTTLIAMMKADKEIKNKYMPRALREIIDEPTDRDAEEVMAWVNKYGWQNDPNSWNKLRSVWFAINESPRIHTEKKNKVKRVLMSKGLTMHYNDAKVIDNYRE